MELNYIKKKKEEEEKKRKMSSSGEMGVKGKWGRGREEKET